MKREERELMEKRWGTTALKQAGELAWQMERADAIPNAAGGEGG
jgi:hypothetical protein